jgi:hypothetical protein
MHHHNYLIQEIVLIIQILAWPIVVLTIFLFLKNSIKDFMIRIRKIGYKDTGIEADLPAKQEGKEESPIEKLSKDKKNESLEKILSLFAPETIELLKGAVRDESKLDSFETPVERETVLFSYSQVMYLIMHFNKNYYNIYGSQLRILQRLNSSVYETKDTLRSFYDDAKSAYPKLYESYSYDSYLNFLLNNFLIIEEGNSIKITILGKDFLKFIIESSLSFEKAF